MIREYDECKGWSQPGLRSCAHWLNWKCGISLGTAREKVRVAPPENEDYLMVIARHGIAAHVERLVRHYRSVERKEALKKENQRHDFRELQIYPVDDGASS